MYFLQEVKDEKPKPQKGNFVVAMCLISGTVFWVGLVSNNHLAKLLENGITGTNFCFINMQELDMFLNYISIIDHKIMIFS